ncbi:MAG: hypothetical protein ACLGGU_06090, partial [Gammaproteobacteria bacterium]
MDGPAQSPRVGIVSSSENQRALLKALLERNALCVVFAKSCGEFPCMLRPDEVDVLLLDLAGEDNAEQELLDVLLAQQAVPIVFNDSPATRLSAALLNGEWGKALARKLTTLAHSGRADGKTASAPAATPAPYGEKRQRGVLPVSRDVQGGTNNVAGGRIPGATEAGRRERLSPAPQRGQVQPAARVWVLGASIGGPQALKRFLAALTRDLPAGAAAFAGQFWPGALTIALPRSAAVPDLVVAG